MMSVIHVVVCFFKQKTAYELRISDWSSDVCSSDLLIARLALRIEEAGTQLVVGAVLVTGHVVQQIGRELRLAVATLWIAHLLERFVAPVIPAMGAATAELARE